jgi:diguanylate cyclase (GGDEF)-like protein/PAS domain S-box-containing protein
MSNPTNGDHFESLFEYAPISLWEEDYSEIKNFFDTLRANGVTNLSEYLDQHPEEIENSMRRIRVMYVNQETLKMFGATSVAEVLSNVDKIFRDEMRAHFRSELMALWNGEMQWSGDGINYRLDGEPLDIRLHWRILPECESTWECVLVSLENITALKKAEMRFHHLFMYAPISLWEEDYTAIKREFDGLRAQGVTDLRTYLAANPQEIDRFVGMIRIIDVNQKTLDLFGAIDKETLTSNLDKVFQGDTKKHFANELADMWDGKTFYDRESVNFSLSGEPVYVQLAWTLMPGSEQDFDWVLVALQDITARKKAEEYLRYLGTHDVMTGLYNRAFFEETLEELESKRYDPISVIIIDLNNLKPVNDVFGHHTGDKLIRRAAEVLSASAGKGPITARIGGDEFSIIMPGAKLDEAEEVMERIQSLTVMNNKYYRDPELSLSVGAAVSEPGLSLEKVISIADNEMYKNKGFHHRRRKEDFFKRIE